MNPAQLLAQFDRLSDAPDAIPRLRRFILDLAVRGKLVEQDPRDEPASELLKRIQTEKERLTKGGKVKQEQSLLPLVDLELPFSIPNSWVWVRLDTLTEKITDGEHLSPNKTTAGMPLLTATHVTSQGVTFNNSQYVSIEDGHKSRQRCDPHRDDILICSRGTIGRCAVVNTDEIFCLMGSVILARFPKETVPGYFNYFLSTDRAQLQMRGMSGATAVQALYLKDIRICPVALPPLAEQRRIVAKVDELMALCDRLEEAQAERESRRDSLVTSSLGHLNNNEDPEAFREHVRFYFNCLPRLTTRPEQIKQLRQTILSLAVRGRLVPQDPNDAPASTGIDLVSKEARKAIHDGIIRRHGLSEPADNSGLLDLPPGWRWTRLAEITRPVPYSIKRGPFGSAIRKDMFVAQGFKVYEQQNAISGDFTKGRYYITESKFEELRAFELHPNEILVSCSGTVGKVAIVPSTIARGIINQALLKLSLHQSAMLNEYFLILFPAFYMETETLTKLHGTAQKNIPAVEVLREMPFPLPPLAEQHRIVVKVEELMSLCGRLEAQLTTAQTESRRLLEAVLNKALLGAERQELVAI